MIRAENSAVVPLAPEALWERLSDTERINRMLGLPPVRYDFEPRTEGGARVRGEARFGPLTILYDEEPYRWVRPNLWWVQRVPRNGPVKVFRVGLTLEKKYGDPGTSLTAWSEAEPRGWQGRLLARRIVESCASGLLRACVGAAREAGVSLAEDAPAADSPAPDSGPSPWRERLEEGGLSRRDADRLLYFLRSAPSQDVTSFRPFALADRWRADRSAVLQSCLLAVRAGALDLHWRLLCPACRGAGPSRESLADLTAGAAHCPSCDIRFGPAFDRDVEVCFSVAPALRRVTDGDATFCVGGPNRSRHLALQWFLPADGAERVAVSSLPPGAYRLRSPQSVGVPELILPLAAPVTLDGGATLTPEADGKDWLLSGAPGFPTLLRLERTDWREDVATAAQVTALHAFRRHFGSELLAPGSALDVRQIGILFTDIKGSTRMYEERGDAPSYAAVREHFAALTEAIEAQGGAVVKTIGDAVMAAFPDPADAVRAAIAIQSRPQTLTVKLGVHAGPALAVGANGALDYFGHTVNVASRIQQESLGGDVVLTQELAVRCADLLDGLERETLTAAPRGAGEPLPLVRLLFSDERRGGILPRAI